MAPSLLLVVREQLPECVPQGTEFGGLYRWATDTHDMILRTSQQVVQEHYGLQVVPEVPHIRESKNRHVVGKCVLLLGDTVLSLTEDQ